MNVYLSTEAFIKALMNSNLWDDIDLTEAVEHCYVASELIQIFDMASGHAFLLKPEGVNTEGMKRYEI